jgi:glycosyltransferase involved in cell wall biosynthesis
MGFIKRLALKPVKFLFRRLRFLIAPLKRAYTTYKNLMPDNHYHDWASQNEEDCFVGEKFASQRRISVVVPAYNTLEQHLKEMIYSVINQHYENWELILVNASDNKPDRARIAECAGIDARITIVTPEKNYGIAGNTNVGIKAATGDYITFLDHDDLLHPCALHVVAATLEEQEYGLLYSDEDKITHSGDRYFGPHCKPSWSPDLLRNVNYINHMTVIKTAYVRQVEGLRADCDGAQDYDLLLRVIDTCKPEVRHIPRVLYHWRAANSSTAQDISNKPYIFKAGKKALQEHLDRQGIDAKAVVLEGRPGYYKVEYAPVDQFVLAIGPVAPARQRACAWWLQKLLEGQQTSGVKLVIGDWYKPFSKQVEGIIDVSFVIQDEKFWKHVSDCAEGLPVVCLRSAVTSTKGANSLRELASVAAQSQAPVVPILTGQDGTVLDAGLVKVGGRLQYLFEGYRLPQNTYFGDTDWVRNIDGATGEVFAVKSELLAKIAKHETIEIVQPVLWAHQPFRLEGELQAMPQINSSFNQLLTKAGYKITMKTNVWGEASAREQ